MTERTPQLANLPPTPEHDSFYEEFQGLLASIANHEAKLAITAIITSQPDTWFGGSGLWNEVRTRQGETPGWLPDRKGPIGYCFRSLGPIGLVVKGQIAGERGDVTAFKAVDENPRHIARALAMSGSLMEWSLAFPDISLQKILGPTSTTGGYRPPVIRYEVLKQLVDNSGSPLTYMDIARPVVSDVIGPNNVFASVRDLTDQNIVSTKLLDVADDVTLRIKEPYRYHGSGRHFDSLTKQSQIANKAISALWDKGHHVINFSDFSDAALAIDPEADLTMMRQYWSYGASNKSVNMPSFEVVDRTMDYMSIVALKPEHTPALNDLVRRLREIENNTIDVAHYSIVARTFIASHDKMSALFAKANQFSANVAGREGAEIVEDQILQIVAEAGELSISGVHKVLSETGRRLTEGRVAQYLTGLAKEGRLASHKKRINASKRREYKVYSLSTAD